MKHFLEKRDPWGHGMGLWVLVVTVFLIPLAVWSMTRVEMHNDVKSWLPSHDHAARVLTWFEDQFTQENRFLVSWPDSSINDDRIDQLAVRVEGRKDADGVRRGGSPYFTSVATPQDLLARIVNDKVDVEEGLDRINGILIGSGPLRVRLTDVGKRDPVAVVRSLTEAIRAELGVTVSVTMADDLAGDTDAVESVDDDETDFVAIEEDEERAALREQIEQYLAAMPDFDFVVQWPELHINPDLQQRVRALAMAHRVQEFGNNQPVIDDCFLYFGSPASVAINLSEAGEADQAAAFAELERIAAEVGIPDGSVKLGGSPVARTALNTLVKRSSWNRDYPIWNFPMRSPSMFSVVAGALVAFVMLRSIRLVILVSAAGYYTSLLATSLIPATGGSMNMVLVVMPTLLTVLTVSAAIHVANYWKHAAQDDPGRAVIRAVEVAKAPCFWASVTTAVGLLSLASSPLIPVRDFGIYSGVGCLISLVVVLYVLPTLMQFWPARPPSEREVDTRAWKTLGMWISRYRYPVTAACLLIAVASTYGLTRFRTETKVIRYFPEESRLVQDYYFLEQNLSGIVPVETIVRFGKDATRLDDENRQRRLNFFERTEIVRRIQERIREIPDVSGTLSLATFQEQREPPKAKSSFAARAGWGKGAQLAARRLRESKNPNVRKYIAFPDERTDLVEEGDGALNQAGDELWRITAQVAIMTDLDYGDLIADLNRIAATELRTYSGTDHQVTGMVPVFLRTQQAVLESLIISFGLAFVLIAGGMMVLLRHPVSGFFTMLPNLFPIGVVFGLISWSGMRVDIGTMITASVALGIAIDGTLHLLAWFKKHIEAGAPRSVAVAEALGHCGPAMWQTSACVGLGLLALFPAELLLISRFGWLMAALIATAMVGDVIFLPALLAGPLGALIEKTTHVEPDPTSPRDRGASVPSPHLKHDPAPSDELSTATDGVDPERTVSGR